LQQAAVHIDEHILTERLMAGDPEARELVYDHFGPALYSIILQVLDNAEKADEVLMKVFVTVFDAPDVYRNSGNSTLFGWLMRLAREFALQEATGFVQVSKGVTLHDKNLLQRFANNLPDEKRSIFHLCYYKGLPKEAVARMLGLQAEDVGTQLRETMIAFRKFLED
jgi:DNA-directed RNA polymerase specialized sigma24 family protein